GEAVVGGIELPQRGKCGAQGVRGRTQDALVPWPCGGIGKALARLVATSAVARAGNKGPTPSVGRAHRIPGAASADDALRHVEKARLGDRDRTSRRSGAARGGRTAA